MAIRSSYDSKINKTVQLKPIVLEIEKAMLHNEVHRFSDEIIFVSDDFKEVPPFIHPIYSPEKDIAFIDVRGFSSVGQDGNLALKGDVDSELTLLRAKLELVWQRAPRGEVYTAFHFSNLIFVRWLADTICHKQGLQLGQKSKVLAVTGLYNIGLYYNNITDEFQINKYAEMISRDFYIPLEEVFSVIDTLDNPFPRDVNEYVEALKTMQISPRLANLNTVGLYSMLGGSWFMTANAIQLVGLAVEYPPCFAAMVSMATRHKIFKKTQIGERVDRSNKGGAFDQFTRSLNTVINNNLGNINPNRQRAGMESIPYNAMLLEDGEFIEQHFGMEGYGKAAGVALGAGLLAAFITWLMIKFTGGGSGGGGGGGGAGIIEKTETKVKATVEAKGELVKHKAEAKTIANEIRHDTPSHTEAMNETLVADVEKVVEKGADKRITAIVNTSRNPVAIPVINLAVKYEPSQEATNHWANMEALVKSIERIDDPTQLAAIFEVYKRAMRDGGQNIKGVISDFIKHPLFKEDVAVLGGLFCAGRYYHVPNDTATEFAHQALSIYSGATLDAHISMQDLLVDIRESVDGGMSGADLDIKYGRYINEIYMGLLNSPAKTMLENKTGIDTLMEKARQRFTVWPAASFDTFEHFDSSTGYVKHLLESIYEFSNEAVEPYIEWLKGLEIVVKESERSNKVIDEVGIKELIKGFDAENREMLEAINMCGRINTFGISKTMMMHNEIVNGMQHIVESTKKFQGFINDNLKAMQREMDRAAKKAGMESHQELEGEFLPAEGKGVGMEVNVWTDALARVGIAVVVGMFVEWLIRKLTGSSGGGGGGGGSRASVTFRVETAAETLVRVGEKLNKTKSEFLEFNSELNRRKLKDEDLMGLVASDADRSVLRKFLTVIPGDDHLLRCFAVLLVNAGSGKDDSQFTFLGVSATDQDWDKWVLAAFGNFRKVSMPNDMEFEKYLLFCGLDIPGTFMIADVIESIDVAKALEHIDVESEIVEEIFKLGESFTDAGAKRIADEIRKGGSGPASDSKEVAIPGTQGKTYKEIFTEASHTRFTIWPGAIFRNGLKEDEKLAEIKADQWRSLLDTKRLSSKLEKDKNTLARMENKAKSMKQRLDTAARNAKIDGRFSSNPEDHQVISDFLSKKSNAMAEIQAYLQAVNAYTRGVDHQANAMNMACRTMEARIGNVKTLLKKVD